MGGVGVEVRFLTTLEVGVGFFSPTPTPDAQLDHFLHYTPKLGILLKWYNFFFTLVESEISCCVTRFPLILTVKFHSLCDEESKSEISERSESEILESRSRESEPEILPPTPQP